MQQGKEQLLTEKLEVKEVVNREIHSVIVLEIKRDDQVM
jgi:hypothetical protein